MLWTQAIPEVAAALGRGAFPVPSLSSRGCRASQRGSGDLAKRWMTRSGGEVSDVGGACGGARRGDCLARGLVSSRSVCCLSRRGLHSRDGVQ